MGPYQNSIIELSLKLVQHKFGTLWHPMLKSHNSSFRIYGAMDRLIMQCGTQKGQCDCDLTFCDEGYKTGAVRKAGERIYCSY